MDCCAVDLVTSDTVDVYHVLLAADGDNLALCALVGASDDKNFVVFSDGNGPDLKHTSG